MSAPEPAVLLGDGQTEQPELAHRHPYIAVEPALDVPLVCAGLDDSRGEVLDRLVEGELFLRVPEVHSRTLAATPCAITWRAWRRSA